MEPFDIQIDLEKSIVTIQGIKYSFELFNDLAFAKSGLAFAIERRDDGVLTLRNVIPAEPLK